MHKPLTRAEVGRYNADSIVMDAYRKQHPSKSTRMITGHKCLVCGEWLWTATNAHAAKHGYESVADMVDCGMMIRK